MARRVLVDTAFLVALLDPRDDLNGRAVELAKALARDRVSVITTDAVLLEFANYFARGPLRLHAARWLSVLRADPGWEVVAVERDLLLRAEVRFARHADKDWSLTDCHSMELMRERRIRDVATTDAGFAQVLRGGLIDGLPIRFVGGHRQEWDVPLHRRGWAETAHVSSRSSIAARSRLAPASASAAV